eukprot:1379566-Amorphochlora_amoeboformis.AAC.1
MILSQLFPSAHRDICISSGKRSKKKMHVSDYKIIKIVGRGAFGEVRVVTHPDCKEKDGKAKLLAMKMMKKGEMFKKNQIAHIKAEREVLATADNPWIVQLFHSWQGILSQNIAHRRSIKSYMYLYNLPGIPYRNILTAQPLDNAH